MTKHTGILEHKDGVFSRKVRITFDGNPSLIVKITNSLIDFANDEDYKFEMVD